MFNICISKKMYIIFKFLGDWTMMTSSGEYIINKLEALMRYYPKVFPSAQIPFEGDKLGHDSVTLLSFRDLKSTSFAVNKTDQWFGMCCITSSLLRVGF